MQFAYKITNKQRVEEVFKIIKQPNNQHSYQTAQVFYSGKTTPYLQCVPKSCKSMPAIGYKSCSASSPSAAVAKPGLNLGDEALHQVPRHEVVTVQVLPGTGYGVLPRRMSVSI
jgi:hypothetical protein